MLNLWRLRLLQELADLGTMTAVANAVQLSRPAVSQHLAELERETDVVLIERSGRGIRLTDAGVQLVAESRELFQLVEEIEADLAAQKHSVSGQVRLAAFSTFSAAVAPSAIATLNTAHPRLEVTFSELEPIEATRGVLAKQIDIAVVDDTAGPQGSNAALEFHPLLDDPFYAAISVSHPHAGKGPLNLNVLANDKWATNRFSVAYHSFIMRACWDSGFTPTVLTSCRNSRATLDFVRTCHVVAVVPGLSAHQAPPGVQLRPIDPPLNRTIHAAVVRGSSHRPAIAAALTALKAASDARRPPAD